MKVVNLIDFLKKFDDNMEIKFIAEVESGFSHSIAENANLISINEVNGRVEFVVAGEESDFE